MDDVQILTAGHIEFLGKHHIDYNNILDKAVKIIHERETAKGLSEEEIHTILSGAEKDDEGFRKAIDYIESRIPRTEDQIRDSLFPKLQEYAMKRNPPNFNPPSQ